MAWRSNVLVFDSGVGGLSVFQEIYRQLPNSNYIYMFDNKGYPYGELEHDKLISRVNELILSAVDSHDLDIVVIACNTASTIVLPSLRSKLSIPVVGVVPAIKPASVLSKKAVGLIATPATVKRSYTHNLIKEYLPSLPVELIGTTELVDMAENKLRGESVNIKVLTAILSPLIGKIDVAVLGCTHFPLLSGEISQVLGSEVTLVDSGKAIANRVVSLISNNKEREITNSRQLFKAYNSATPYKEVALNISLNKLGFKIIETLPTQDV